MGAVEELTRVFKRIDTYAVAKAFADYMESIGVKKYDRRRFNNSRSFFIRVKKTSVECRYFDGTNGEIKTYGNDGRTFISENENILMQLKLFPLSKNFYYAHMKRGRDNAFQADYTNWKYCDETLLTAIMAEHNPLFDALKKACGIGEVKS